MGRVNEVPVRRPRPETNITMLLKLLSSTLEGMAADSAKYPQLKLPKMQQQRLDAVLLLLRGK